MKTWILCVDPLGAKLYERESAAKPVHFSRQIPYPRRPLSPERGDEFLRFIAENTDKALGADDGSNLIICAEPSLLMQVREYLGPQTRRQIVGSIDHNLCHVSDDQLTEQSQQFMNDSSRETVSRPHL
jgi:hypothetical protein